MHFLVEKAKHNTKPVQCFACLQFGHVSKYCKRSHNPVCSVCGGNHRHDQCDRGNLPPTCYNCNGAHTAISSECPVYKERQQKSKETIERYTESEYYQRERKAPRLEDMEDFPPPNLHHTQTIHKTMEEMMINTIARMNEKMLEMIQEATQRILEEVGSKFEQLAKQLMTTMGLTGRKRKRAASRPRNKRGRRGTIDVKAGNSREANEKNQGGKTNRRNVTKHQQTKNPTQRQKEQEALGTKTPTTDTTNEPALHRANSPTTKRKEISPAESSKPAKSRANDVPYHTNNAQDLSC